MKEKMLALLNHEKFGPSSSYWMNIFALKFDAPGWLINDVNIPKDISSVVEQLKEKWRIDTVCSIFDNLSHGGLGHVIFLQNYKNVFSPKGRFLEVFDTLGNSAYSLIARISYGTDFNYKKSTWDMADYQRLHLSVLGTKFFRPEVDSNFLVKENVYFTIRWEKEGMMFDDQTSEYRPGKMCFNETRMTFSQAQKFDADFLVGKKDEQNPVDLKKYLDQFVVDKINFEFSEIVDKYLEKADEKLKMMYSDVGENNVYDGIDVIPIVGYEHVLDALSNYGDVGVQDLKMLRESKPFDGLNYFVSNLVPAMELYVKGQRKNQ